MGIKSKENKRLVENICIFYYDLDQKKAKNNKMENFIKYKIHKIYLLR